MTEQTLNVPQILVFLVVTVLAVRWYFSKSPAAASTGVGGNAPARGARNGATRVNVVQIDQIAQMFPQMDRRCIAWELSQNGGNVVAVTEKVLSGRGLETPPASFQLPPSASRTPTPLRTATTAAPKQSKPDLITRYNLASKIGQQQQQQQQASGSTTEEQPKTKAWSSDRNERQANLQRRREEMILAARRKLEEKDKAKA